MEKDFPQSKQLNKTLSGFKNRIEQLLLDMKLQKIILNKNEFHTQVSLIIKPNTKSYSVPKNENANVLELYKSYFEKRRELNSISQATYIQNLSNYRVIKIFEEKRGAEISFENINMEFYQELAAFYIIERKNTNRKINTNIKLFKVFLRDCLNKGIYDNNEILKSPKLSEKATDNLLALTSDELEKIRTCELTEKLKITRDLFLFQVQTMLRFSDLMNIQPENIDIRLKELKLWQLKTSEPLIIPLTNFAIEFVKQNKSIPKFSLTTYSQHLQEICKAAGLTEMIEVVKFVGNERISKTVPKYKLVSSHTARRTGITLLLHKGIAPDLVMKISGPKTYKAFNKYIKTNQNFAVSTVKNVWDSINNQK